MAATTRGDLDRAVAADSHDLPFFEHAKQLGLCRQRQLSDLVEEQRSGAGVLERAPAQAIRTRERASLVAEELALDELLGQCRAVHGDQRGFRAGSSSMQLARHQFLARPALAHDQDTARNRRNARDRITQRPHRAAVADERRLTVESGPQRSQLSHQPPA